MICLTFDVEERFHSHLTPEETERHWEAGDRIASILDHLEQRSIRATFFVVSELAEHYPQLVRRMAQGGCEVASHSHSHIRMDGEDRERIKRDVERSKKSLEDLTGQPVVGFRAPTWSLNRGDDWFWEMLVEQGFRYDSSLFPFRTHMYGSFGNPIRPFDLRPGLREIPPSVSSFGPLRLPYGGGFYFRLYPRWLTRKLIDRDISRAKTPIVYIHPWEFDTREARLERGLLMRFIGNHNTEGTWREFTDLLEHYPTISMVEMLDAPVAAQGM